MALVTRAFVLCVVLMGSWGCASTPKRLDYHSLTSEAMGREMAYAVYEPRDRDPDRKLPLVVFLHGGGDKVDCWDKAQVGQHMDEALEAGRIPKVVVAVPEGNLGFWENWADGSRMYRDWVLEEMLPAVQQRYGTAACPDDCHVMGVSMGGHGALRMALKRPEAFRSVTALSAPILDTELMLRFKKSAWWGLFVPTKRVWGASKDPEVVAKDDLFIQWQSHRDLKGVRFRMAWGNRDRRPIIRTNERFKEHLEEHGIGFTWQIFDGPHEWHAWKPAIERAISVQVKGQ